MNFLLAFSVIVKTDGSFAALVIVLFPSAFSYHLLLRFTSLQSKGVASTAPWGCHAVMLGKRRQQVTQPFFLFCLFHHFLSVLPIFSRFIKQNVCNLCNWIRYIWRDVVTASPPCARRPWRHITGSCVHPGLEETLWLGPCLGLSHWHSAPCNFKQAQNMVAGNFKL